jgi:hypothetical protein
VWPFKRGEKNPIVALCKRDFLCFEIASSAGSGEDIVVRIGFATAGSGDAIFGGTGFVAACSPDTTFGEMGFVTGSAAFGDAINSEGSGISEVWSK